MKLIKKCRYILIPFSFIYFLIVSLRNIFYRHRIFKEHTLDATLVSVGNITWGGTGKTPLVLFIVEALLKRGSRVAILLRGYGADEPALLSRLTSGVPVMVGKDRVKSGLDAIDKHSVDTLLLDDGFQYRRLKRDLDIILIDATNPFGNGWMIPAGSMRESLRDLKRAGIFLITRVDLVEEKKGVQSLEEKLKKINPGALIIKSIHSPGHIYKLSNDQLVDVEALKKKDIVLVSAIGNPDSFEKTIHKLDLKVKKHFIFRDHHWYKEKDLKKIESYCVSNKIDTIITTEKDAVRIRMTHDARRTTNILVLSIKLEIIENEKGFLDRLFGIYNN